MIDRKPLIREARSGRGHQIAVVGSPTWPARSFSVIRAHLMRSALASTSGSLSFCPLVDTDFSSGL